jgi:class 3 adenylate cyclase/tetratricopeptide (TPR) repeat protein
VADDGTALTREQIERAIAAQEGLRATLGDDIVDATIDALRARLPSDDEVTHQRKLATVLFTDVVGSTQLMRGHDPEETMAVMDSALARLAVPVRAHGGRVTRFMGDGFMAVFGIPTARENDPEMAVRAGLAIVGEAVRVARALEAEHGLRGFAVRVGVNTGLVVTGGVTEAADTIMGDAVNLAARLESAARPGAVLISDGTRQHVRDRFVLEDGGPVEAKGFADPVRTYRVVRRAVAEAHDAGGSIEGLEIPMVGRQRELARLMADLDDVVSSRHLRALTVLGEAGLGKSRLVDEFRGELEPVEHVRLEARALLETRDLTYALVKDLVERRYGIRADAGASSARERLVAGITVDLGEDTAEQKAQFIGQLIGYDFTDRPSVRASLGAPQHVRSRAVLYLTGLLAALASRQPVVLIIEDLHWADADSLDVLEDILHGLTREQVLLVATARPSSSQGDGGWRSRPYHRWIRLEPLSSSQAEELAEAALRKIEKCPTILRDRLVEQAGGNPFYLEETIRMLVDDGVIATGGDAWSVDVDRLSDMRIPPTITGVIQARLDGLPLDQRTVLQQASVVGRIFWDTVVQYLASSGSRPEAVEPALAALDRREMIHRRPTSVFGGSAEYTFHHETQRSVAYEGVLRSTRRTYHSLVADWLLANGGDRSAELGGLIANHLEQAGRDAEALDLFEEAAEAALASYAIWTADGFFERALSLVPADAPQRRFALLLGREKTLGMRGLHAEQRSVIDELTTMVGDDPVAAAQVDLRRVWSHYYSGLYGEAAAAAHAAVQSAERTTDLGLEARARSALAWCLLTNGDLDAARPQAEHALAKAVEADDERARNSAHNTLGLLLLMNSEFSAAREHLIASIRSAQEWGDLEREIVGATNVGVIETRLGNYAAARAAFERAQRIGAEVGDRLTEAHGMVNLAWVAASEGDWSRARDLAEQATGRQREIGHPDAVAESLMWLGHSHLGLAAPEEARTVYEEALEIRQELGQTALAMGAHAGIARATLAMGDLDAALAHAQIITDHLDGGGTLAGAWEPLRIHLTCVQVLRAAGRASAVPVLERARRLLVSESERITDPQDRRAFLEQVPWHREILALAASGTDGHGTTDGNAPGR